MATMTTATMTKEQLVAAADIQVWHRTVPTFQTGAVDAFPIGFELVAGFDTPTSGEALDFAYAVTQNVDHAWTAGCEGVALKDRARSTSVGDVIVVGTDRFQVAGIGFEQF